MSRKRKKPLPPRRKRMTRQGRMAAARTWLPRYPGKNIVRGYARWFGVSPLCAAQELRIAGLHIDREHEAQLRATEIAQQRAAEARNAERRREREWEEEQLRQYVCEEPPAEEVRRLSAWVDLLVDGDRYHDVWGCPLAEQDPWFNPWRGRPAEKEPWLNAWEDLSAEELQRLNAMADLLAEEEQCLREWEEVEGWGGVPESWGPPAPREEVSGGEADECGQNERGTVWPDSAGAEDQDVRA